jgi:anthranilate synthase component 1
MFFRTITLAKGRKISAYGLFSSFPEMFSALLEDPSGKGRQFLASRDGHSHSLAWNADQEAASDFFRQWKARLKDDPADSPAIRCLFYAAYEAGNFIERLPDPKTHAPGPVLWTFYPHYSLCIDAENSMLHLAAGDEAQLEVLAGMVEKASGLTDEAAAFPFSANRVSVGSADGYKNAVRRVKAYIAAGDIFQANIARFWDSEFADEDLPALYAELRRVNPAPFSAYARIKSASGLLHILSASPERLFRISSDGHVDTRPIAGTRRRGEGEADQALSAELLLSGKERAEHIMLVDLERNDMGRVCRPGSVKVDEHMVIERYATVQHIVSNVCGDLAEGRDAVDVFRAMFPGGTITGCPKIRCMEIIHELEDGARGPYTGGLGYMAWDGSADMNILIRTFWHFDGRLHLAAGAGIVADSSPEFELKETEHKAEGLFMALSGGRGADARALKI